MALSCHLQVFGVGMFESDLENKKIFNSPPGYRYSHFKFYFHTLFQRITSYDTGSGVQTH